MNFVLIIETHLGVRDDGYPKGLGIADLKSSIENIKNMAEYLNSIAIIKEFCAGSFGYFCAIIQINLKLTGKSAYSS